MIYGNVKLHGDDGRRLEWNHILNRFRVKKVEISLERSVIQIYDNKIFIIFNLTDIDLKHEEINVFRMYVWNDVYYGSHVEENDTTIIDEQAR